MATIAEVARHLNVDREDVKTWAVEFAGHLTSSATPPKGQERQFDESDLRVLALVAGSWEENPDLENIHAMLNAGEQHGEPYLEFGRLHSPLFREVPDEIDETWQHGAIIGGMAMRNWPQVARAYKTAADDLVKLALSHYEPHEIDYPIIFLYRHCLELYLKTMLNQKPEHHVIPELILLLEREFGGTLGGWIRDRLLDFHKIDQRSDVFRYAEPPPPGELWVNLHQLKTVMDRIVEAFERQITSSVKCETMK